MSATVADYAPFSRNLDLISSFNFANSSAFFLASLASLLFYFYAAFFSASFLSSSSTWSFLSASFYTVEICAFSSLTKWSNTKLLANAF
jgi:hypothetical protein